MNKIIPALILLTCLSFWACTPKPVGGDITNTYWNLSTVKQGNKETTLNSQTSISAIFSTNRVSGISVCNRYQAGFSAEATKLAISDVTATERMCDAINMENTYLGLLSKATAYSVLENQLIVFSEGGQLIFETMSEIDIKDIQYAEGVGRLVARFQVKEGGAIPHFYPIVRVDRPGNYPFAGQLIDPSLYEYFDEETSEIWNNPGGDVMSVGKYGDFYICRVPGRYVSSDIALFRLEKGVMKRSETIAWAWCDEGWCNQQDAWLQDINKDGRTDIVQHYSLTDDKGKIREERFTVLLQNEAGDFVKSSEEFSLNMNDYKMANI